MNSEAIIVFLKFLLNGKLTIEYNGDLDFIDEIIRDYCKRYDVKADFSYEKPINTRFITMKVFSNWKIFDDGKYDGTYHATTEEQAIKLWEDDTQLKAKDHKITVKKV